MARQCRLADPPLHRFQEMAMVNGSAPKAPIAEEFGGGIMSAKRLRISNSTGFSIRRATAFGF